MHVVTDRGQLDIQKTVVTGYIAAIIPFIVIVFLFGFLNTWYAWHRLEWHASRRLIEMYGPYVQNKFRVRLERAEEEDNRQTEERKENLRDTYRRTYPDTPRLEAGIAPTQVPGGMRRRN